MAAATPARVGAIGLEWASQPVAFELLSDHDGAGESWASLAGQSDVTTGRMWVAVPLFVRVAPRAFADVPAGGDER